MKARKWAGQTVCVIGSGPSLNAKDCARVEKSGLTTIAVNSSWKMARFCHILYAGDLTWWRNCGDEIDIEVEKYTASQNAEHAFSIKRHKSKLGAGYNSGMLAIELAIHLGASRVLLLGFDCSVKNGTHWHGDHKNTPNPNKNRCDKWKGYFQRLADHHKNIEIINCSRETELLCFPRMTIQDALCGPG